MKERIYANREEQRRIVITSIYYQSAEEFNRNVIAPLLNLTTEGAANLLSSMADDGLLQKRQVKQGAKTFIGYCKPVTKIARMKWRNNTNEQLRLVNTNFGACGR